jgi:hypothetical protein
MHGSYQPEMGGRDDLRYHLRPAYANRLSQAAGEFDELSATKTDARVQRVTTCGLSSVMGNDECC